MPLVVPRNQGHGGSHYHGIVLDYAARHCVEAVRHFEGPLGEPHAVADGRLGLVDDVDDLEFGGFQLALGPPGRLFLDALLREIVLHDSRGLEGEGGHYHQKQAGACRLLQEYLVDSFFQFHNTEARAALNSGMGRLVSLSMMIVLSPA